MIVLSTDTREIEIYVCCQCGHEDKIDKPQCAYCGAMNSYTAAVSVVREKRSLKPPKLAAASSDRNRAVKITEIEADQVQRIPSGFPSLDCVLGIGMARTGVILLGGDPGAGKSTLALQILGKQPGETTLYGISERPKEHVCLEGTRLNAHAPFLHVLGGNSFEDLIENAHDIQPSIMVVDSLQVYHAEECRGRTGGVTQAKYIARALCEYAQAEDCIVIIVCHVNKDGSLAGPNEVKHDIDVDIMLERGKLIREGMSDEFTFENDPQGSINRISSTKNRFGGTMNVGFLSMTDNGLRERGLRTIVEETGE